MYRPTGILILVALLYVFPHSTSAQVLFEEKPYLDVVNDINNPRWVRDGDIDGDGDMDLVVAASNEIGWLRNEDGEGAFSEFMPISQSDIMAEEILIEDIDGDDDADFVIRSPDQNLVAWYRNEDGAGTFSTALPITTTLVKPFGLHLVDFDQDEDLDLLTTSLDSNLVVVYRNMDGQGNFGEQEVLSATVQRPYYLTTAYIDSDSLLDIAVASAENLRFGWLKNEGEGGFSGEYQEIITNYFVIDTPEMR